MDQSNACIFADERRSQTQANQVSVFIMVPFADKAILCVYIAWILLSRHHFNVQHGYSKSNQTWLRPQHCSRRWAVWKISSPSKGEKIDLSVYLCMESCA